MNVLCTHMYDLLLQMYGEMYVLLNDLMYGVSFDVCFNVCIKVCFDVCCNVRFNVCCNVSFNVCFNVSFNVCCNIWFNLWFNLCMFCCIPLDTCVHVQKHYCANCSVQRSDGCAGTDVNSNCNANV